MAAASFDIKSSRSLGSHLDAGGGGGGGGGGHISEVFSAHISSSDEESSNEEQKETSLTPEQIEVIQDELKGFKGNPLLILGSRVPLSVFILCIGEPQMPKSVKLLEEHPRFKGRLSAKDLRGFLSEKTPENKPCCKTLNKKLTQATQKLTEQIKVLESLTCPISNGKRPMSRSDPRSAVEHLRVERLVQQLINGLEMIPIMEQASIPLRFLLPSLRILFSDIDRMNVEAYEDIIGRLEKSEETLRTRNHWVICNFPFLSLTEAEQRLLDQMFSSYHRVVEEFLTACVDFFLVWSVSDEIETMDQPVAQRQLQTKISQIAKEKGEELKAQEQQFYQKHHIHEEPLAFNLEDWLVTEGVNLFLSLTASISIESDVAVKKTVDCAQWQEQCREKMKLDYIPHMLKNISEPFFVAKLNQLCKKSLEISLRSLGLQGSQKEMNSAETDQMISRMLHFFQRLFSERKRRTDLSMQTVRELRTTLRHIGAIKTALEVVKPQQDGAGSAAAAAPAAAVSVGEAAAAAAAPAAAVSVGEAAAAAAVIGDSHPVASQPLAKMSPAASPLPAATEASASSSPAPPDSPAAASAAAVVADPSASRYLSRLARDGHGKAFGVKESPSTPFQQNGWFALAVVASAVTLLEKTQSGAAERKVLMGAVLDGCHRYFEQAAPIKDPSLGHSLEARYGGAVPAHLKQLKGMEMIGRYPHSIKGRGGPLRPFVSVLCGKTPAGEEAVKGLTALLGEVFQRGDLQLLSSKEIEGRPMPAEIAVLKSRVLTCRQIIESIPQKLVTANTRCLANALYHLEALESTLTMMYQHPEPQYELLYLFLIYSSVEHVLELVGEAVYGKRTHTKIIAEGVGEENKISKLLAQFDTQRGIRYTYDFRYKEAGFRKELNWAKGQFVSPAPFDVATLFSKKRQREAQAGLNVLEHILGGLKTKLDQPACGVDEGT